MKKSQLALYGISLFAYLLIPVVASAQRAVGVVTALQGEARLTRATAQSSLRFREGLRLRDVVDTREKSLARILFGGKSTVTVRELSRLEVREETLPTGATRSIHELFSGGILVHVVQELLRPGDEVQIRTPNAIAAIRGTTLFVQYIVELAQSIFVCITGSCLVTPQGLPPITLAANASVNVTGDPAGGLQVSEGTITQADASRIVEGFAIEPAVKGEANQEQTRQAQTEQAAQLATGVVEALLGVAAAEQTARQELQPKIVPPPKLLPGGDPFKD